MIKNESQDDADLALQFGLRAEIYSSGKMFHLY